MSRHAARRPSRRSWIASACALAALGASAAHAATLVGAQVSYSSHLGAGLIADLGTQTVANGTVFKDTTQDITSFVAGGTSGAVSRGYRSAKGPFLYAMPLRMRPSGKQGRRREQ